MVLTSRERTSSSYTLDPTALGDSGALFSVVVTNGAGTVTSASATLTVNIAPGITTQPASVTVTAPASATFTVVTSGTAPFTYQWRRNGVVIGGATGASYILNPTAGSDSGATFDVVVSNAAGSVTSTTATLTVNVAPAITTQPANLTVTAPASATFSVVATGTSLTYQWRRNGVAISGATSASYVLNPTAGNRQRLDVRRRGLQRGGHRHQFGRNVDRAARRHGHAHRRELQHRLKWVRVSVDDLFLLDRAADSTPTGHTSRRAAVSPGGGIQVLVGGINGQNIREHVGRLAARLQSRRQRTW